MSTTTNCRTESEENTSVQDSRRLVQVDEAASHYGGEDKIIHLAAMRPNNGADSLSKMLGVISFIIRAPDHHQKHELIVASIFVRKEYRLQGHGRRLMDAAAREGELQGCRTASVGDGLAECQETMLFFTKFGFEARSWRPGSRILDGVSQIFVTLNQLKTAARSYVPTGQYNLRLDPRGARTAWTAGTDEWGDPISRLPENFHQTESMHMSEAILTYDRQGSLDIRERHHGRGRGGRGRGQPPPSPWLPGGGGRSAPSPFRQHPHIQLLLPLFFRWELVP